MLVKIARADVLPGMIVHSSHGYRLRVTEVLDNAQRQDLADRHVEIRGVLAHNADVFRNERYPANSLVDVEHDSIPTYGKVTIDRDVAIDLEAAAIHYARKLHRDAKSRRNAGPINRSWRATLRTMAKDAEQHAQTLRKGIDGAE